MPLASLTRRGLVGGAAALLAMPAMAAGQGATRTFSIWRDGSDIGRHRLAARRTAEGFEIDIDVDIAVKLLGFTAYRYTLTNREVWAGRQILSVEARCNDDGDRSAVTIRRAAAALEVDGTAYQGSEPLDAVTTSYFAPEFLDRTRWISTQSGEVLAVDTQRVGPGRWKVAGDLRTVLTYTDGEWTGSEFETRGSRITYQTLDSSGTITPLWQAA